MSEDRKPKRSSPSESKSDREMLELRIDLKLKEAKDELRKSNGAELDRLARVEHEPKYKRLLTFTAVLIAILVINILWEWFGLTERIKEQAGKIIDQKLIDPQLANTLDEALSKKAVPFIAAQVHPIETNVAALKANVSEQTAAFKAMTLDVSNKQAQLTSDQTVIREQIRPLFGEVTSLQATVDAAQAQANKLQDEQNLMALLNRGELFDRDAIQQLRIIAQGTNEIARLAQSAFDNVQRSLIFDRGAQTWLTAVENMGTNQYGGPFTSDELAGYLCNAPPSVLAGIVNSLGNQPLFVPKLVDLAHQCQDLWTINRVAKKLNELTGVSFYPWDLQPLDSWWKENRQSYTNWPFGQFSKGMDAVRSVRYDEALTNFESVLATDPTADQSRALAVACAIEVGNLETAQKLNTNYAIADGRWEQWAQGKMMLATNAIQLGTEKFVSLSKKYPTFLNESFIAPGNNILRQVDWTLYSRLVQPTNNTSSVGNK